ncbi:hypothetical protein ECH_0280 [Ehrlichia chaffeensis str. Arkansas]|uniref:Uncharacterized protein n=1 Tax=Ehrlichia chaffeensis (strain ATCC CRL-10679 / Arkansas) TaxID=205920 RepID=Q2GHI2_EHRCR|nr:hypothetical protein ECH_0280 [Ehrlichia chaffeensis str. Arkansas]
MSCPCIQYQNLHKEDDLITPHLFILFTISKKSL